MLPTFLHSALEFKNYTMHQNTFLKLPQFRKKISSVRLIFRYNTLAYYARYFHFFGALCTVAPYTKLQNNERFWTICCSIFYVCCWYVDLKRPVARRWKTNFRFRPDRPNMYTIPHSCLLTFILFGLHNNMVFVKVRKMRYQDTDCSRIIGTSKIRREYFSKLICLLLTSRPSRNPNSNS